MIHRVRAERQPFTSRERNDPPSEAAPTLVSKPVGERSRIWRAEEAEGSGAAAMLEPPGRYPEGTQVTLDEVMSWNIE